MIGHNGGPAWDANDYGMANEDILRAASPVTNPPRLIALCGPAQSGKSTAAAIILTDPDFVRVKFADPLKDMLRTLYENAGLSAEEADEKIEGSQKELPCPILGGQTPRHAMITLGTEWGRDLIAPSLWVTLWKRRVNHLLNLGFNVVADDLRFANEAAAVAEIGGVVVRMTGRDGLQLNHVSERGRFSNDIEIQNTGTMDDLRVALTTALAL